MMASKPSKSAPRDIIRKGDNQHENDKRRGIAVPERYTDEPDVAGSSSSLIPLLINPNYDDDSHEELEGELPGYSDGENGDNGENENGGDAPPPFESYRPVVKRITTRLGLGDTLTVSHDPHLNTDGEALYRWLMEESLVPPNPHVHITGQHSVSKRDGNKTETTLVTDFDLKLLLRDNLLEYKGLRSSPILSTVDPKKKTNRGGRWKSVATEEEARTVRSWADQYCEDRSTLKEFIMKRSCEGWDLLYIKNELEAMIRATNYRGRITVEFPVFDTRVEVFPPNFISRMRKNEYWRWFFYLTFLWIFAWPYLWFFTKRYHVAETIWHYSLVQPSGEIMYVYSEAEWLQTWGAAIKRAVVAKRQSMVTERDIHEVYDRARSREQTGTARVPKTGNSTIDGALGFIAGVGAIANDMQLSRNEVVGWGGDESW